MNEYLPFVTIDVWTMIFTLVNLVILFLLLKRFLFRPINDIISARENEIDDAYKRAEENEIMAQNLKNEYEQRLITAKNEADSIIKSAVTNAETRSDLIVKEAENQSKRLIEKTEKQLEREKKDIVVSAQKDVAEMVVEIAEKLIGKRFSDSDDEKLIEDIINGIKVK